MTLRNATRSAAMAALTAAAVLAMPVHAAPDSWRGKATTASGNCQKEYAIVAGVDGSAVTGTLKAPGQSFVMAGTVDQTGGFAGAFGFIKPSGASLAGQVDGERMTGTWKGFGCSGAFFIQRIG